MKRRVLPLVRGGFGTVQISHNADDYFEHMRQAGTSTWSDLRKAKKDAKAGGYREIHFIENPGGQRPKVRIIKL